MELNIISNKKTILSKARVSLGFYLLDLIERITTSVTLDLGFRRFLQTKTLGKEGQKFLLGGRVEGERIRM